MSRKQEIKRECSSSDQEGSKISEELYNWISSKKPKNKGRKLYNLKRCYEPQAIKRRIRKINYKDDLMPLAILKDQINGIKRRI